MKLQIRNSKNSSLQYLVIFGDKVEIYRMLLTGIEKMDMKADEAFFNSTTWLAEWITKSDRVDSIFYVNGVK